MTRLVVTGSRDWMDRAVVEEALRRLPVGRLAHGGARGLDTIAAEVATELGWEVVAYPADGAHGRAALTLVPQPAEQAGQGATGHLGGRYALEALLAEAGVALAEDDTEGLRRLLRAALAALSLPLDTAAGAG